MTDRIQRIRCVFFYVQGQQIIRREAETATFFSRCRFTLNLCIRFCPTLSLPLGGYLEITDVKKMNDRETTYLSRLLLLAPVIFVCHFLEESIGFVEWFNSHVARGITPTLFWTVNFTALFITLLVVGIYWLSRSGFSLALAAGWFGLLMAANAVFHIVGGIVDGRYVPGLATAILLYLPYYSWFFVKAVQSRQVGVKVLVVAAMLGSLPMLIHGYLIIFRGSRLF
jgi:Protein of unknown function with HXXEE motif